MPRRTRAEKDVHFVKPWLIPNCDPNVLVRPCPPGKTIVDPAANYALNNPVAWIGKPFVFTQEKNPPTPAGPEYYALDLVPQATDCPSSSAAPAGSCNQLGSTAYHDNIACANTALALSCGATVNIDPTTATPGMRVKTREGTRCLIHTVDNGNFPPTSCTLDLDPDCFVAVAGSPVTISGGQSNPNPSMRVANISRSDSVVTVPIFDYQTAANNPCPGGACGGTAIVTGFLQLGIQSIVWNTRSFGKLVATYCTPPAPPAPHTGPVTTESASGTWDPAPVTTCIIKQLAA
jgi:hypothetical protein